MACTLSYTQSYLGIRWVYLGLTGFTVFTLSIRTDRSENAASARGLHCLPVTPALSLAYLIKATSARRALSIEFNLGLVPYSIS